MIGSYLLLFNLQKEEEIIFECEKKPG